MKWTLWWRCHLKITAIVKPSLNGLNYWRWDLVKTLDSAGSMKINFDWAPTSTMSLVLPISRPKIPIQANLILVAARKLTTSREILLWMTPSEAPKALQASECSELLDPTRASCWISAQHQPGKFTQVAANLHYIKMQTSSCSLSHLGGFLCKS